MSIAIIFFLVTGLFFFTIGVIGVLRFPDFYSRLHAAGKSDSLAAVLIIIAAALYQLQDFSFGSILVAIKIVITSYSIHYTKLYDVLLQPACGAG